MSRLRWQAAGVVGVLTAYLPLESPRFWAAYAAAALFWVSVCAGAAAFVASLEITNAGWSRRVVASAEEWAGRLPLAVLVLMVLPLGAESLYPWARGPQPGLETWLAPAWLLGRELLALAVLTASVLWLLSGVAGRRYRRAVGVAIIYALVGSLLAWDLIMSLEPGWTNTLFGAYFFVGGLYAGMAVVAVSLGRGPVALGAEAAHDLGKLLFGGAMVWGYFLWSQYLVIWYGNLPHESGFWLRRTGAGWAPLGLAIVVATFLVPFVALLPRRLKRSPRALAALGTVVLLGLWAEKLLLLGPAVRTAPRFPVGLAELATGLGLAAIVIGTHEKRPAS